MPKGIGLFKRAEVNFGRVNGSMEITIKLSNGDVSETFYPEDSAINVANKLITMARRLRTADDE